MADTPENNSLTDIRYKLLLRMMGELELTDSLVAADNPYELEASVIDEFKAYRKAWTDLAFGSLEGIHIDYNSEMLLAGINLKSLLTCSKHSFSEFKRKCATPLLEE